MKDAQCKKCLQKFHQKDIYTIQQFQYRKTPPYKWTLGYFAKLHITEWDSFCESCLLEYQKESADKFQKT
jgi:hypothetical protein